MMQFALEDANKENESSNKIGSQANEAKASRDQEDSDSDDN